MDVGLVLCYRSIQHVDFMIFLCVIISTGRVEEIIQVSQYFFVPSDRRNDKK